MGIGSGVVRGRAADHRGGRPPRCSASTPRRAVLGSLHKDTRPLPLPLVSERDPEFVAALLGTPSQVLAVDSVLQALLYLSWQSGDSDAAKASPAAVLPDLLEHVGLEAELTARTGALIARADDAHPDELFAIAAELGARARDRRRGACCRRSSRSSAADLARRGGAVGAGHRRGPAGRRLGARRVVPGDGLPQRAAHRDAVAGGQRPRGPALRRRGVPRLRVAPARRVGDRGRRRAPRPAARSRRRGRRRARA